MTSPATDPLVPPEPATDPVVPPEPDQPILASRVDAGIPGFPGPFEVGRYAHRLRDQLRAFAKVAVIGEILKLRIGNGPQIYFELRDRDGALPCAMWRNEFDRCGIRPEDLRDGIEVVVAGGCDFYPGSATASPGFVFRVNELRPAGEGDLLARLERLRRRLAAEGLFDRQKELRIAALPRTIGVVTAEGSAARRDFLAALERRGWRGRLVWGYAPVQDRRAAPAISKAIADLAILREVETIVVTRGGGSIADLWAFCDESLCRTVALLGTPVISAVGHETDRTLIDDVAAHCCSTPTHAAEVAVRIDCGFARERLTRDAVRLDAAGRGAVVTRARQLAALSRAPRDHLARHRVQLHQKARELRAASRRGFDLRGDRLRRFVTVLQRKLSATQVNVARIGIGVQRKAETLDRAANRLGERRLETVARLTAALNAHDPQRTLERGYALALGPDGEPLANAAAVREARTFDLRMADGSLPAAVRERRAAGTAADPSAADAADAAADPSAADAADAAADPPAADAADVAADRRAVADGHPGAAADPPAAADADPRVAADPPAAADADANAAADPPAAADADANAAADPPAAADADADAAADPPAADRPSQPTLLPDSDFDAG